MPIHTLSFFFAYSFLRYCGLREFHDTLISGLEKLDDRSNSPPDLLDNLWRVQPIE